MSYRFFNTVVFVVLSAIAISCKDDDLKATEDCPKDYTCDYFFIKDAELVVNQQQPEVVTKAGSTLFRFSATFQDDPGVADDEVTESVVFQLSADADSFVYHSLTNQAVYYTRACYCVGDNFLKIDEGYIHGQKKSETEWSITGDLTVFANGKERNFIFSGKKFVAQ